MVSIKLPTVRCPGCGADLSIAPIEIDHIHPRSRGGSDKTWNRQLLCRDCNRSKGDKLLRDWRPELLDENGNLMSWEQQQLSPEQRAVPAPRLSRGARRRLGLGRRKKAWPPNLA